MQALTRRIGLFFSTYLHFAKMFFALEPTYLIYYVTSRCNSRCKTCFNWRQNNSTEAEPELSLWEIEKIARNAGHLYYVTLGGGEPFLRDDIDEICRLFYEQSHTRVFSIPTNCLAPERIAGKVASMLGKCPEAIFRVSMSIDGIGELHDRIRGIEGNFAKIHETYAGLDAIRGVCPRLEILANTTFCADNQDHMAEIHDYVSRKFSLDVYGLTLIRGDVADAALKEIDLTKYAEASDIFAKNSLPPGRGLRHPLQRLMAILPVFTRLEILKTHSASVRTYTCHAIKRLLVMDARGNIYPCEMLKVNLGNVRENGYTMRSVLKSAGVKELLTKIRARKCNCTWECAIQSSLVFNVRKYPAMIRYAFFR